MLVSFPDPTTHVRKGSGDIGADSWFCKLSNRDYLHRFVLEHVRSRDGAQDQENAPMSPDPFPSLRVDLGTRLVSCMHVLIHNHLISSDQVISQAGQVTCTCARNIHLNLFTHAQY